MDSVWYAVKVGHCHLSLWWLGIVQQLTTADCSQCYIRSHPGLWMAWICYLLWVSLTSAARIYYNPAQQSKYRIDFRAVRLTCLCLRKQARANCRLGRLRSNQMNALESRRGVILKRRGSPEKRTWKMVSHSQSAHATLFARQNGEFRTLCFS